MPFGIGWRRSGQAKGLTVSKGELTVFEMSIDSTVPPCLGEARVEAMQVSTWIAPGTGPAGTRKEIK